MIDTKRLETDAAYWLECGAPEDATAAIHNGWVKYDLWLDGKSWFWWPFEPEMKQAWRRTLTQCDSYHEPFIPRPTAPAAPEWDGRHMPLPGQILEVKDVDGNWKRAKLRAISDSDWWIFVVDEGLNALCSPAPDYRAIPTKDQREREELIELAFSTVQKIPSTESAITAVVDAIIAAGWTKP